MKFTTLARSLRTVLAASATTAIAMMNTAYAVGAVTPPVPAAGQAIINQAVGTYDDGNSHNFYTTSNQVVVTIQNAPSVSISASGGNIYTDGNNLIDLFVITNSGNATATLALPNTAEQVTFPTGSGAVTQPAFGYYETDPATGSPQKFAIADINSQNIQIPAGTSKSLWVTYPIPYGASAGANTTSLSVTLTQAAVNAGTGTGTSAVAAQSASATALTNDTVTNEAQLDLNTKFIDGSASTAGTLQIKTDAQNSGGMPAHGLQSAQALLATAGATRPGVFIVQQIPFCANCSARTRPQLTAASTVQTFAANGYVDSGTLPLVVYAHDASMKTWDTTWQNTTVTAVGVYLTCTATSNNICLNGTTYPAVQGTQQSQNDGLAGLAPHPAVTILSTMNYPTGFHSSDTNAFSTLSNGAIMGNVNNDILAPTYTDFSGTLGTIDGASVDLTRALANTTPQNPVTGASNQAFDSSPASFGVRNGPLGNPEAIGMLDGGSTLTSNGDFTAFVLNGSAQGSAAYSVNNNFDATSGSSFTLPSVTYFVENTIRNEGTTADSYTLTANTTPTPYAGASILPNGWTVTFFAANADNSVGPALTGTNANTTPPINSGATFNYFAGYTPGTGALTLSLFTPYEAVVTATSVNSVTAATSTKTPIADPTIHVMFVNGYVKMTKTATTDISACSASVNALASQFSAAGISAPACPGAKITYTVNYQNLAPSPLPGNGNISLSAKNFQIIEDGNGTANALTPQNTSNWAQFSNGLTDLAFDASAGSFNPVFGASDPNNAGWSSHWVGNAAGSTKFTDIVGELKPATGGSLQFSIVVKGAPPVVPALRTATAL